MSQLAPLQRARYLMGTVCEISASGASERDIAAAFDEAARVEHVLSTWRSDSELSKLNRSHAAAVSPELYNLLHDTLSWQQRTAGTFNPLIEPLIHLWRTRDAGALPDDAAIARTLPRLDSANAHFEPGSMIRLSNDAAFEEGGFGKGYAIDRMLQKLPGSVVINFGGQLAVRGTANVSIADPQLRDHPVVTFSMSDGSLATSSGSEQTFEVAGRRFSHIIDPRSGIAVAPRGSASALCGDALTADILSTALYVMGVDEGLQWAEANHVAALFITPDHHIRMSPEFRRLARSLEISDRNFKEGV